MNLPTTLCRLAGSRQVHCRSRNVSTILSRLMRVQSPSAWSFLIAAVVTLNVLTAANAADKETAAADAKTEKEMKPYKQTITGTDVTFEMLPIPGGTYTMGSPEDEADRYKDESPQREVKIEPFWMGKCEVTWDEYDIWSFSLDQKIRKIRGVDPTERDKKADAVTRPTPPYTDMTFSMGHDGFPAICMTQLAAKTYCKWLSEKTGHYYRLPTEAEWEYACRAGTTTAFSFGDDPEKIGDYAWYGDNSDDQYQKVGKKKPNPWGLHDMHGNVNEWVLDQYQETYPAPDKSVQGPLLGPLVVATELYPRVVRGGSWEDDPADARSATRRGSEEDWKYQDPQIPQSVWYHTDALFVGFRVVRPLRVPNDKERAELKLDAKKVVNQR
ncbi:Serine/threonine-protein kinase pkn1 [Symmachiella macrocystis]|uniref:Serine/threonine-protein kinase pkn1 n=1 Tax=Symmachiella macrocystis TaxID=2527985 RepID=A0A5C6BIP0_9PLAN|nr:SUMF1/EgtB/PvdO family nonheme iron enzyme [Symmachiella macrocystis]TWU11411.1 Serine/threonine-protein kinase pkn1 [Symmachiella macrocystis]